MAVDNLTEPDLRTGRGLGLAWASLGVVYVVWGSTYLAIRLVVETMPPLLSGGSRFLVSGIVLMIGILAFAGRGALRMTRAQLGTAMLAGLLLPAFGNGLVVIAEQHVASGLAALLVASVPLYVVVLRRMFGERASMITVGGVVLGMAGLAVLVFAGPVEGAHGATWWAPWLVIVAALSWATGSVLSTRLPVPPNPFALASVEMLTGGTVMLAAGFVGGERLDVGAISLSSWIWWFYLATVGGILAYSAYVYVLGKLPVSTVATYAYVNPVIAVLLGVVIVDERFGLVQLIGGVVVVAAVVLVVRGERGSRRGTVDPPPGEPAVGTPGEAPCTGTVPGRDGRKG